MTHASAPNITLIVSDRRDTEYEPYLGDHSAEGCIVFGQSAQETAFMMDLRLRESLRNLRATGTDVKHAILVWSEADQTQSIIRRTQLMARALGPGSTVTLAVRSQTPPPTQAHIQELAQQAQAKFGASSVTVNVFLGTPAPMEHPAAPLTPAWHRIQKGRTLPDEPTIHVTQVSSAPGPITLEPWPGTMPAVTVTEESGIPVNY